MEAVAHLVGQGITMTAVAGAIGGMVLMCAIIVVMFWWEFRRR